MDEATRKRLDEMRLTHDVPNWDGYDALPVTGDAIAKAMELADGFMPWVPTPYCSADPDGCVVLEWHAGGSVLSLSIFEDGAVVYLLKMPDVRKSGRFWLYRGVDCDEADDLLRIFFKHI